MKISSLILVSFILFSSCKKNEKEDITAPTIVNNSTKQNVKQNSKLLNSNNECPIDSIKMQTTEYNGIKFYTENSLRGNGVINLSITKDVEILNMDKTLYGKIILKNNEEESLYEIKLPRIVIAREIIPDTEFRIFSFDAEKLETDNNFMIIYLNKEKKLIEKEGNKYTFNSWEKYAKTAFIQLTPKIKNSNKEEQMFWYKALKIEGDSMQIKSVPKTDCDYIENYKNITKWIKWKDNSCKQINFNFCY